MPLSRLCPAAPHRTVHVTAILAALVGLAGCSLGRNQFAPVCPTASLLPQAADLARYRDRGAGIGRDLTDLMLQAKIVRVAGTCEPGDNAHSLDAKVTVSMELTRGPAAIGRAADIPYFVAVAEGDHILDKRVFTDHVTFPADTDRALLVGDPIEMRLPITADKSGAAYTVWVGFQLTPAEMAQVPGQ